MFTTLHTIKSQNTVIFNIQHCEAEESDRPFVLIWNCCYAIHVQTVDCRQYVYLLQILSVDYDYVSDSMLAALSEVGLLRFIIHVHGIEEAHPGTSNAAWTNFVHQK